MLGERQYVVEYPLEMPVGARAAPRLKIRGAGRRDRSGAATRPRHCARTQLAAVDIASNRQARAASIYSARHFSLKFLLKRYTLLGCRSFELDSGFTGAAWFPLVGSWMLHGARTLPESHRLASSRTYRIWLYEYCAVVY